MWLTGAAPVSPREQLKQTVTQLSTGVVALSHDAASEPCKGLKHVMQHVQTSCPHLVQAKHRMLDLSERLKGLNEEVQDSVQSLESITSNGSGCLQRAESSLDRSLEALKAMHLASLKRMSLTSSGGRSVEVGSKESA